MLQGGVIVPVLVVPWSRAGASPVPSGSGNKVEQPGQQATKSETSSFSCVPGSCPQEAPETPKR